MTKEYLMHRFRVFSCATVAILLCGAAVQAQDSAEVRRLTILTFSEPFQLPGKTLPAGTYRFEIPEISGAAHAVRVSSEDGTTVHGTFPTIPSTLPQRDLSDQSTLLMFAERPAGQPQAVREWFYPGRSIGEEFLYPRQQAMSIAQANRTSVATIDEGGRVGRVDGSGAVTEGTVAANTASGSTSTPAPGARPADPSASPNPTARQPEASAAPIGTAGQDSSQARQNPAAAPAARSQAQSGASARTLPQTLPQTASQLSLLVLLSALTLAAGLGVHQLRRRGAIRG